MVKHALQVRIRNEVKRYVDIANAHYRPRILFVVPSIDYDVSGRAAGYAYTSQWRVSFNPVLLNENIESFIARTVPHEVAHLIDQRLNPPMPSYRIAGRRLNKRSVHGPTWKAVMRLFGVEDSTRCHSYDVATSAVKFKTIARYIYVCPTCKTEVEVGPKHHAGMQRRLANFVTIKACGHRLTMPDFKAKKIVATGEERRAEAQAKRRGA